MSKKSALGLTALSAGILFWIYLNSGDRLAGFARDPQTAFLVLAIVVVISIPILWASYRRARRNPDVIRFEAGPATAAVSANLDEAPRVLAASRWKVLGWLIFLICVAAWALGVSLTQPGVCRIASAAIILPPLALGLSAWLCLLVIPPSLTLSADGLSYVSIWTSKLWRWDEVREVRVQKLRLPFIGWLLPRASLLLSFRRYAPPDAAVGSPSVSLRSIWPISSEDLGRLLTAAHVKWSTPEGAGMIPVPRTYRYYVQAALGLGLIAGFIWLLNAQPCGPQTMEVFR